VTANPNREWMKQQALELNADLAKGYYLNEELRQLWKQPN